MLKKVLWLLIATFVLLSASAEAATTYTVVRNDTLSKIGQRFCGSSKSYLRIAADNGIIDHDVIYPGQPLTINCDAYRIGDGKPVTTVTHQTQTLAGDEKATWSSKVTTSVVFTRIVAPGVTTTTYTESRTTETPTYVSPNQVASAHAGKSKGRDRFFQRLRAVNPHFDDIEKMIYSVFGPEYGPTALAISLAENDTRGCGRRSIRRNPNGTYDHGVFQINDVHRKRFPGADFKDCYQNIQVAYQLFKDRLDKGLDPWRDWATYNNGWHKKYLNVYRNFGKRTDVLMATNVVVPRTNAAAVLQISRHQP